MGSRQLAALSAKVFGDVCTETVPNAPYFISLGILRFTQHGSSSQGCRPTVATCDRLKLGATLSLTLSSNGEQKALRAALYLRYNTLQQGGNAR